MLTDHDNIIRGLNAVLASQAALTTEQAATLRGRLDADPAGRGFKDGTGAFRPAADLLPLLNQPFGVDNPEPQPSLPVASCSKNDFAIFMGTAMGRILAGATTGPGQALLAKWSMLRDGLLPFVALQDSVPVGSVTITGLIEQLVSDGVISQPEADALTTVPDPAWTPTVLQPSEAETLFGPGAVLEKSDLERADVAAALAGA